MTAHDALFTQAGLRPGERLLVHGGAGGVGTAAVQLGRAAGATVIATVRNESLRGAVAELGAEVDRPRRLLGSAARSTSSSSWSAHPTWRPTWAPWPPAAGSW